MQETEKERQQPMKPAKVTIDERKLTAPQLRALELARIKGTNLAPKWEDLTPKLGLTPEEADQFGRTLEKIRQDSRLESDQSA